MRVRLTLLLILTIVVFPTLLQAQSSTIERYQFFLGGGTSLNYVKTGICRGVSTPNPFLPPLAIDRFCFNSFWSWHALTTYAFSPSDRLTFISGLEYHRRGSDLRLDPDTFALYGQQGTSEPFLHSRSVTSYVEVPLCVLYNTSDRSAVGIGVKVPFYSVQTSTRYLLSGEPDVTTYRNGLNFDTPLKPYVQLQYSIKKNSERLMNVYMRAELPTFSSSAIAKYWVVNAGIEINMGNLVSK
jgi:hypothetical protein